LNDSLSLRDALPTEARGPGFFPAFVSQHSVRVDLTDARDLSEVFPCVELPASLATAVRKRQVEFIAGRYCAHRALQVCAPELGYRPIASGPSREPVWPTGIVGAITHTHGYASVAVARTRHASAIGLDAEVWMKPSVAEELADRIAGRDEVDALVRATGLSFSRALTLIFSAKETVFKCLFSEVRRYFDFRDVSVECADVARGQLVARLQVALTPSLQAGRRFSARFELDDSIAFTGMVVFAR
jgi:enterobactin synthetase component D